MTRLTRALLIGGLLLAACGGAADDAQADAEPEVREEIVEAPTEEQIVESEREATCRAEGGIWDPQLGDCACPEGQVVDPVTGECIDEPIPADAVSMMVVQVGDSLLPIRQFDVVDAHGEFAVVLRFDGGDTLGLFPDYILLTDPAFTGDPTVACSTAHFHMPGFLPNALDLAGNVVPEPNAPGCGYGRVTDAFRILLHGTAEDEWMAGGGRDRATAVGDVWAGPRVSLTATVMPLTVEGPDAPVRVWINYTNTGIKTWDRVDITDAKQGEVWPTPAINTLCDEAASTVEPGQTIGCQYSMTINPDPGLDQYTSTVTINVIDGDGLTASASAAMLVIFDTDAPPLVVTKSPDQPEIQEPGPVEFTVEVVNTGDELFEISAVLDTIYGSLLHASNPLVTDNDCPDQSRTVNVGASFTCSFTAEVGTNQEDGSHLDELTVVVTGADGVIGAGYAEARVAIAEQGPADTTPPFIPEP